MTARPRSPSSPLTWRRRAWRFFLTTLLSGGVASASGSLVCFCSGYLDLVSSCGAVAFCVAGFWAAGCAWSGATGAFCLLEAGCGAFAGCALSRCHSLAAAVAAPAPARPPVAADVPVFPEAAFGAAWGSAFFGWGCPDCCFALGLGTARGGFC